MKKCAAWANLSHVSVCAYVLRGNFQRRQATSSRRQAGGKQQAGILHRGTPEIDGFATAKDMQHIVNLANFTK